MTLEERIAQLEERMAAVEERPIPSGADKIMINIPTVTLSSDIDSDIDPEEFIQTIEKSLERIRLSG